MAVRLWLFLSAVYYVLAIVAFGEVVGRISFNDDDDGGQDLDLLHSICTAKTMFKRSIPKGETLVDHLNPIGMGISAEECVNKCCALGPSGCQYLWVFGSACFGVSCDDDHSACEPRKVSPSFTMETVYIQMNYASIADILAKQILLGDLDEEGSRSGGSRSGGSREGGDSPPVADAGSDFTVQLPVNEIHLYGNGSRDDKSIKSYHWELSSAHFLQPILKDANTSVLHILDLIPGTYTFTLTVVDSADQISRDDVVVKVIQKVKAVVQPSKTATKTAKLTPKPEKTVPAVKSQQTVKGTPFPAVVEEDKEFGIEEDDAFNKKRNALKIAIPVLLSVAFILILSAAVVGLSACFCERNRRRMRRFYKYKRLPETIEKT